MPTGDPCPTCPADDQRPIAARGKCMRCYMREWRAANPDRLRAYEQGQANRKKAEQAQALARGIYPKPLGPKKPNLTETTYSGAHKRVTQLRGPARDHTCACGKPAAEWAYTPRHDTTPWHRIQPGKQLPRGHIIDAPYSLHPADYAPSCHTCHRTAWHEAIALTRTIAADTRAQRAADLAEEDAMPIRHAGLPTAHDHVALRKQTLQRDGYTCQACGHHDPSGQTLQADHIIELADGGDNSPANLTTLCIRDHARKSAASAAARARRRDQPTRRNGQRGDFSPEQGTPNPNSGLSLRKPPLSLEPVQGGQRWPLFGLDLPGDGDVWPRVHSGAHPRAVGSYGARWLEWVRDVRGWSPFWWQRCVGWRALEHDAEGRLVWGEVVLSTPRQVGKSSLLRSLIEWRLVEGPDLFGNDVETIGYAADRVDLAQEVMRPTQVWAAEREGWSSRRVNGEMGVTAPNGSRWLARSLLSMGIGYSLTSAVVDEAWKAEATAVDDRIAPSLVVPESAQLWLVSTASPVATPLVPARRRAALEAAPGEGALLLEWSAAPGRDVEDEAGWREATPRWVDRRARLMAAQLRVIGEESFRAQWLNQWPQKSRLALVDEEVWASWGRPGLAPPAGVPVVFGLESTSGGATLVSEAWESGEGPAVRVRRWAGMNQTLAWLVREAEGRPGSSLLVGASLWKAAEGVRFPGLVNTAGGKETRQATHLWQGLVAEGGPVWHPADQLLTGALLGAVVVATETGPTLSIRQSRGMIEAARCALWAVWQLRTHPAETAQVF